MAGTARVSTFDSFTNFTANLGYGTNNVGSGTTYGFHPLSRERQLLEWMYRGSWVVRKIVDAPADDATREGIAIEGDMKPDDIDALMQHWDSLQIWKRFTSTLKWSRLYGGCIAVIMIQGQDMSTPFRIETVGRDQFRGLLVLDRWQVYPQIDDLVTDFGADYGLPKYYSVVNDARSVPRMKIHHSRCIRFDGIELPYWQKMAENEWGLSIIEPLWDRMIAFDSATQGAAQLVYKAHLRVLKFPRFREIVALGQGQAYQGLVNTIAAIRSMQTNEGLTVLDAEDEFQANTYSFAGLSDMLVQFSQQVSGAADVPMTRIFGQSPAGMNSTGESDLRNYYDGVKSGIQEGRLRQPVTMLLDLTHRSLTGQPLPRGFGFKFKPLWQLTDTEKADISTKHVANVDALVAGNVIGVATALKELRQSSETTGFGSNITDEDIEAAEAAPPAPGFEGLGEPPEPGRGEDPNARQPDLFNEYRPKDDNPRRALQLLAGGKGQGAIGNQVEAGDDRDEAPDTSARVNLAPGTRARVNTPFAKINFDRRSIIDVDGMQCVIETAKGESRVGYGWSSVMPCHYGYVSGTSSAEGPTEQMDCFVGEDLEQKKAWVVAQTVPGTTTFDEHKCLLAFPNREAALGAYFASFSDGSGPDRVGSVREMETSTLRDWLERNWKYGQSKKIG